MKTVTTVLLCLALAVAADAAPTRNQPPSGFNSYLMSGLQKASFGLLDPSKMNIQNSASFGAAFGGGGSLMQSLYTTRIGYQISDPLTVTFLLGLQNSRMGGNLPNSSLTMPVGGMTIDWRPRDDIFFRLSVMRAPVETWNSSTYDPFHVYQPYFSPYSGSER